MTRNLICCGVSAEAGETLEHRDRSAKIMAACHVTGKRLLHIIMTLPVNELLTCYGVIKDPQNKDRVT
jgi:hypothetical protein